MAQDECCPADDVPGVTDDLLSDFFVGNSLRGVLDEVVEGVERPEQPTIMPTSYTTSTGLTEKKSASEERHAGIV